MYTACGREAFLLLLLVGYSFSTAQLAHTQVSSWLVYVTKQGIDCQIHECFIMVGLAIIFIKHAELILKQERHEVSEN